MNLTVHNRTCLRPQVRDCVGSYSFKNDFESKEEQDVKCIDKRGKCRRVFER